MAEGRKGEGTRTKPRRGRQGERRSVRDDTEPEDVTAGSDGDRNALEYGWEAAIVTKLNLKFSIRQS